MGTIKKLLIMGVVFVLPLWGQNTFIKTHTLQIMNRHVDDIPWSIFEKAFIGVDSTNNLDVEFYETVRHIGSDGVCFGMCALVGGVLIENGYEGFCKPIGKYSRDETSPIYPRLRNVIFMLHIRQCGTDFVREMVRYLSAGGYRDPLRVAEIVEQLLEQKDDFPIVSVSKGTVSGGHSILPYRVERSPGQIKIFVYDPTLPYWSNPAYYDNGMNYIDIKTSPTVDYVFKRYYASGDSAVYDGWIMAFSGKAALKPSTNPFIMSNAAEIVGKFIINDGGVVQVTDTAGRRLFKQGGDIHNSIEDFETDPSKKLEGVLFIPDFFGSQQRGRTEKYVILKGHDTPLNFEVKSEKRLSRLKIVSGRLIADIEFNGRQRSEIRINKISKRELAIKTIEGSPNLKMRLSSIEDARGKVAKEFIISDMRPGRGTEINISLKKGGEMTFKANKILRYRIKTSLWNNGRKIESRARMITVEPNRRVKIAPSDWKNPVRIIKKQ